MTERLTHIQTQWLFIPNYRSEHFCWQWVCYIFNETDLIRGKFILKNSTKRLFTTHLSTCDNICSSIIFLIYLLCKLFCLTWPKYSLYFLTLLFIFIKTIHVHNFYMTLTKLTRKGNSLLSPFPRSICPIISFDSLDTVFLLFSLSLFLKHLLIECWNSIQSPQIFVSFSTFLLSILVKLWEFSQI